MADPIRFMAGPTSGDYELALKMFWGSVVEAFRDQVVLFPWADGEGGGNGPAVVDTKVISTGNSHQFLMMSDMPEAEEHIPGNRLEGQPFGIAEGTITVDGYLVQHAEVPNDQLRLSHFDVLGKLGRKLGYGLARKYDNRFFRLGVLAARSGIVSKDVDGTTLNIHNGGNRVERVNATVAGAFPVSSAGARNFRDDAEALAELMDNDFVPEEGRHLYITPYIRRILQQDTGIFDERFTRDIGDNSLNSRAIGKLAGFYIHPVAGRLPDTNVQSGLSKYRGNFTIAGTGQPVALAMCEAADDTAGIGAVIADGILPEMERDIRTSTTFMKASILCGAGIMHPWKTGVIEVDDS
jgi:hypothetical protein